MRRRALTKQEAAEGEMGPAMAALGSDRQREFVRQLFTDVEGKFYYYQAAARAGYNGDRNTLKVKASRLLADEGVQRAIAEESIKRLRGIRPRAVARLEALVEDPKHRDHCRAIGIVIDRVAPVLLQTQVNVQHEHHIAAPIGEVMARIAEIAARVGVPARPPLLELQANDERRSSRSARSDRLHSAGGRLDRADSGVPEEFAADVPHAAPRAADDA